MSAYISHNKLERNPDAKIYVGNLSSTVTKEDLNETFSYYGPIHSIWIARNPPGFAFVEFEHPADAEDAVRDTEGRRQYCRRKVCGHTVRIELSNASYKGRKPFYVGNRYYSCGETGHHSKDFEKRRKSYGSCRVRSRSRSRRRSSGYVRKSKNYDRKSCSAERIPKRRRSSTYSPVEYRRSDAQKKRRSSSDSSTRERNKKKSTYYESR